MEFQYKRNGNARKQPAPITKRMVTDITEEEYRVTTHQADKAQRGKALWGRPLWFSLHYGALNYPDNITERDVTDMVGFIKGLPLMIPCDECKNHADKFIGSFSDGDLRNHSKDRDSVFNFFWMFHNHVNQKTGKPAITLEQAYEIFRNDPESAL